MITLHEEIVVPRSVEHCFRYVADFRSAKEWDATATRADKITPGPVGRSTQFDLDCAVGPSSINLVYEIEEFQPWHSVVLVGRGRYFDVRDTIVFRSTPRAPTSTTPPSLVTDRAWKKLPNALKLACAPWELKV